MRRFVIAAFALTVLAACQPADTALSDEDIAAVNNLRLSYTQAVIAGDADGVAALYTEDATEMPGNSPAKEGRAAIRASYGVAQPSFTITSAEVDGRDGLAFDRGTWSLSNMPDADTTVVVTGKYIWISRKQADGSWLWTDLIWNTDAPMPRPE